MSAKRDIPLHESTDAQRWAREFMAVGQGDDEPADREGFLIAWFANAIEAGRSAALRENARLREALQWIVDMKDDCYPEEVAAKALRDTEAK